MSNRQHHQHARTSSQGRKALPPHARPTKPPPLRRGTSYNHSHHHSHHHSQPSPKTGAGWSKKVGAEEAVHTDDEESGMASFLQFCATCEKQIVTPGASILYCSEACRKKDTSRPTSVQSLESVKSPSGMFNNHAASYFESHPPADILPQRSPTVLRPLSTLSDMSISDSNPYSSSDDASDSSSRQAQQESDATAYLEQFYSDFARAPDSRRPRFHRAHTTNTTDSSTIPSLSHSPSSSYGTVASTASYTRPLANRHNPYTTDYSSTKSIDLVLPYTNAGSSPNDLMKDASHKSSASTLTSFRVAEAGDISYEKKSTPTKSSSRRDSTRKADKTLKNIFLSTSPK